ncbi:(2Fe-2S) ferredoxin domain-containing protein [Actinoplanes sp. NPDC023714]|uniref:(2Fe-2S) ferredoxin domain-containing protein n=1 Tax=Actinoplanes sp. NPDC023714 TaxID=3154322 RepID=UPI0033EC4F30
MPDPTATVTVLLCSGHRCTALRHRTDTGRDADLLEALRETVRRTRHAVLVRSECLGACTHAPAVAVIADAPPGAGRLFGPVESPAQVGRLLETVANAGRGISK